ncbi:Phytanoyl-CoA dioxygenase [Balamuthia mandrillaris]
MMNQDRYGLFRPSRDHPEWQTGFNLHLDMNPWTYLSSSSSSSSSSLTYRRDIDFFRENNACFNQEDEIHCQGLLNLIDNREEDGGFIIVPGFKHHFAEWAESHRLTLAPRYTERQTFIQLPRGGEIEKRALRVTCRAGSMVVWDQRTLHGSAPNSSDRFRGAQFIKLFPAKQLDATAKEARAKVVARKVEEANALDDLSELGQKLFGLAAWDE